MQSTARLGRKTDIFCLTRFSIVFQFIYNFASDYFNFFDDFYKIQMLFIINQRVEKQVLMSIKKLKIRLKVSLHEKKSHV